MNADQLLPYELWQILCNKMDFKDQLSLTETSVFLANTLIIYDIPRKYHKSLTNQIVSSDRYKYIKSLHVNINYLVTIEGIRNCACLTSLNLCSNNTITDNDICMSSLSNLTSLDLSDNRLITNECLKTLTNLTSLSLFYNYVITNDGIKNLTNLTSLSVVGACHITDDGIHNLTNLTSIDISGYNNKITDKGLQNLKNLKSLIIERNRQITNEGIYPLTNLTSLTVISCDKITEDCFDNLPNHGISSFIVSKKDIPKKII